MTTTSERRSNLEIVFADWLEAIRRGDRETMRSRLAEDVVHAGVLPAWICRGPDEVIEMAGRLVDAVPQVDAIELVAAGDRVVLSVRGPRIGPALDEDGPPRGQASIVFTLRDGLIVHMQDHLDRAGALAAAGAPDWS